MSHVRTPWRNYQSICGRMEGRVGDQGQRFEVRYKDGKGVEHVMGWTGTPEGAELMKAAIDKHPVWHSPLIVDRQPEAKK